MLRFHPRVMKSAPLLPIATEAGVRCIQRRKTITTSASGDRGRTRKAHPVENMLVAAIKPIDQFPIVMVQG